MSAALYKFLRKAILEGKPMADRVMHNITNSARHDILQRLAHVKPPGSEIAKEWKTSGHMLGEELPWIGEEGKDLLRGARKDLSYPIPVRDDEKSRELRSKAREMYHSWWDGEE